MRSNIEACTSLYAKLCATRHLLIEDVLQISQAVLDALPVAVIAVDMALRVRHVNFPAVELTTRQASALSIVQDTTQPAEFSLVAKQSEDHLRLRELVGDVLAGGPGGALLLRSRNPHTEAKGTFLAARVSPTLAISRVISPGAPPVIPGVATIVALDPGSQSVPPARLMSELYALSRTEAEVALALAGAATAEHVAKDRGVSLDTVRSQIRTILRKTDTANLRDLERLLALVSSLRQPAENK